MRAGKEGAHCRVQGLYGALVAADLYLLEKKIIGDRLLKGLNA
jgi:hypothetical protein